MGQKVKGTKNKKRGSRPKWRNVSRRDAEGAEKVNRKVKRKWDKM
jgi:hypothetical protein